MAVEEIKLAQDQDLPGADVHTADALNVAGPARNQKKSKGSESSLGTLVSPNISRQTLAEAVDIDGKLEAPKSGTSPSLEADPESRTVLEDVADGLHGLFISVADGIKNMEKKILDMLGGGEIDPAQIVHKVEQQKLKKKKKLRHGEEDEHEDASEPILPDPIPPE